VPTSQAAQEGPEGTIQASGQAQVTVPSDRVKISFAVETEAQRAELAVRENAERMDAVMQALRALSVEGLQIETFGYNLRPDYSYPSRDNPGVREIAGYRAQNNIMVTVPDVAAAGEILDAATEAGANRVLNLQFEASNLEGPRHQALAEAVRTARLQAETMAEAMGVELGSVVSVQGGASSPGPRVMAAARFEAAAAPTPIEPGGQLVSASVTVIYRIREPGR
jgi:uncharacterized protein YggE